MDGRSKIAKLTEQEKLADLEIMEGEISQTEVIETLTGQNLDEPMEMDGGAGFKSSGGSGE